MNDHPFEIGIDENGDEYYISTSRWAMILHDQRLLEAEAEKPEVACPHCHKDIADRLFENVESDEWDRVEDSTWMNLNTINYCPYCHRSYRLECEHDTKSEVTLNIIISKVVTE